MGARPNRTCETWFFSLIAFGYIWRVSSRECKLMSLLLLRMSQNRVDGEDEDQLGDNVTVQVRVLVLLGP